MKRVKNYLLIALSIMFVFCSSAILFINKTNNVSALDEKVFVIENGASLRLTSGDCDGVTITDGLRFRVYFNQAMKEEIDQEDVDLYLLIAPDGVYVEDMSELFSIEKARVKIDKDLIYTDGSYFYANAVLYNVKPANRDLVFCAGAVTVKDGDVLTSATYESGDYVGRTIYDVVNSAILDDKEDNTESIMKSVETSYNSWFGTASFPVKIETPAQYAKFANDLEKGSFELKAGTTVAVKPEVEQGANPEIKGKITTAYETFNEGKEAGEQIGVKKFYSVTWKNYDDTVLKIDESVVEGTIPTYTGEAPTRPSDDTYDYTFEGWESEVVAVTENATYKATFTENKKQILVDIENVESKINSLSTLDVTNPYSYYTIKDTQTSYDHLLTKYPNDGLDQVVDSSKIQEAFDEYAKYYVVIFSTDDVNNVSEATGAFGHNANINVMFNDATYGTVLKATSINTGKNSAFYLKNLPETANSFEVKTDIFSSVENKLLVRINDAWNTNYAQLTANQWTSVTFDANAFVGTDIALGIFEQTAGEYYKFSLIYGIAKTATYVIDAIDAIGTPVDNTKADLVNKARAMYDGLSAQEQAKVTNYSTLTDAEDILIASDPAVSNAISAIETYNANFASYTAIQDKAKANMPIANTLNSLTSTQLNAVKKDSAYTTYATNVSTFTVLDYNEGTLTSKNGVPDGLYGGAKNTNVAQTDGWINGYNLQRVKRMSDFYFDYELTNGSLAERLSGFTYITFGFCTYSGGTNNLYVVDYSTKTNIGERLATQTLAAGTTSFVYVTMTVSDFVNYGFHFNVPGLSGSESGAHTTFFTPFVAHNEADPAVTNAISVIETYNANFSTYATIQDKAKASQSVEKVLNALNSTQLNAVKKDSAYTTYATNVSAFTILDYTEGDIVGFNVNGANAGWYGSYKSDGETFTDGWDAIYFQQRKASAGVSYWDYQLKSGDLATRLAGFSKVTFGVRVWSGGSTTLLTIDANNTGSCKKELGTVNKDNKSGGDTTYEYITMTVQQFIDWGFMALNSQTTTNAHNTCITPFIAHN